MVLKREYVINYWKNIDGNALKRTTLKIAGKIVNELTGRASVMII
jgi:hypothetical protein